MKKKMLITLAILASCSVVAIVIAQNTAEWDKAKQLVDEGVLDTEQKIRDYLQTPEGKEAVRQNAEEQKQQNETMQELEYGGT